MSLPPRRRAETSTHLRPASSIIGSATATLPARPARHAMFQAPDRSPPVPASSPPCAPPFHPPITSSRPYQCAAAITPIAWNPRQLRPTPRCGVSCSTCPNGVRTGQGSHAHRTPTPEWRCLPYDTQLGGAMFRPRGLTNNCAPACHNGFRYQSCPATATFFRTPPTRLSSLPLDHQLPPGRNAHQPSAVRLWDLRELHETAAYLGMHPSSPHLPSVDSRPPAALDPNHWPPAASGRRCRGLRRVSWHDFIRQQRSARAGEPYSDPVPRACSCHPRQETTGLFGHGTHHWVTGCLSVTDLRWPEVSNIRHRQKPRPAITSRSAASTATARAATAHECERRRLQARLGEPREPRLSASQATPPCRP